MTSLIYLWILWPYPGSRSKWFNQSIWKIFFNFYNQKHISANLNAFRVNVDFQFCIKCKKISQLYRTKLTSSFLFNKSIPFRQSPSLSSFESLRIYIFALSRKLLWNIFNYSRQEQPAIYGYIQWGSTYISPERENGSRIPLLSLAVSSWLVSAMSNSCYFYLERSARVLVPDIFKVFGILARDITLCKTSTRL